MLTETPWFELQLKSFFLSLKYYMLPRYLPTVIFHLKTSIFSQTKVSLSNELGYHVSRM